MEPRNLSQEIEFDDKSLDAMETIIKNLIAQLERYDNPVNAKDKAGLLKFLNDKIMYLHNFGYTSNLTKLKEDINGSQYAAIIKSLAEYEQLRDFNPVGKPAEIKQQVYLTDPAKIEAIIKDSDNLVNELNKTLIDFINTMANTTSDDKVLIKMSSLALVIREKYPNGPGLIDENFQVNENKLNKYLDDMNILFLLSHAYSNSDIKRDKDTNQLTIQPFQKCIHIRSCLEKLVKNMDQLGPTESSSARAAFTIMNTYIERLNSLEKLSLLESKAKLARLSILADSTIKQLKAEQRNSLGTSINADNANAPKADEKLGEPAPKNDAIGDAASMMQSTADNTNNQLNAVQSNSLDTSIKSDDTSVPKTEEKPDEPSPTIDQQQSSDSAKERIRAQFDDAIDQIDQVAKMIQSKVAVLRSALIEAEKADQKRSSSEAMPTTPALTEAMQADQERLNLPPEDIDRMIVNIKTAASLLHEIQAHHPDQEQLAAIVDEFVEMKNDIAVELSAFNPAKGKEVDAIEVMPAMEAAAAKLANRFNELCDSHYGSEQNEKSIKTKNAFLNFVNNKTLKSDEREELKQFTKHYKLALDGEEDTLDRILKDYQKWRMAAVAKSILAKLPNNSGIDAASLIMPRFSNDNTDDHDSRNYITSTSLRIKLRNQNYPFFITPAQHAGAFYLHHEDKQGKLITNRFVFPEILAEKKTSPNAGFDQAEAAIINKNKKLSLLQNAAKQVWHDLRKPEQEVEWQEDTWEKHVIGRIAANHKSEIAAKLNTVDFVISPSIFKNVFAIHYKDEHNQIIMQRFTHNNSAYQGLQARTSRNMVDDSTDYRKVLHSIQQPKLGPTRWQRYKTNLQAAWDNFKKVAKERPFRMALTIGLVAVGIGIIVAAIVLSYGTLAPAAAVGAAAGLSALSVSAAAATVIGGAILGLAVAAAGIGAELSKRKQENTMKGIKDTLKAGNTAESVFHGTTAKLAEQLPTESKGARPTDQITVSMSKMSPEILPPRTAPARRGKGVTANRPDNPKTRQGLR